MSRFRCFDTSRELWELSLEFDGQYRGRSYGPRANLLFMRAIEKNVGKNQFCALVEVDNHASQKCMDKTGAKLVGIRRSAILRDDEAAMKFEEEHMELIDDRLLALAGKLDVEPRKLLSHVLEYHIRIMPESGNAGFV